MGNMLVSEIGLEDGRTITVSPITCTSISTASGWVCEIDDLGVLEFGATEAECFDRVRDALAMRWVEYAEESDDRMDEDACRLARRLRWLRRLGGGLDDDGAEGREGVT
jgi:hypothetical protein